MASSILKNWYLILTLCIVEIEALQTDI